MHPCPNEDPPDLALLDRHPAPFGVEGREGFAAMDEGHLFARPEIAHCDPARDPDGIQNVAQNELFKR